MKKSRNWVKEAWMALLLVLASSISNVSLGHSSQRSPPEATVVDNNGEATGVTALEAVYQAGGNWLGRIPTTRQAKFSLVLELKEERITTKEKIEVPFSAVRRLAFEWVSHRSVPVRTEIQRRDGTRSVISYSDKTSSWTLEEYDSEGRLTRQVKANACVFSTGEDVRGIYLDLQGFRGQGKTRTGKQGEYFINFEETRSITFPNSD